MPVPRECPNCTVSPHGARIYCESCDEKLYRECHEGAYQPQPEDYDFPMSAFWRGIPQSTPVHQSDQGYQEPDPDLPDATVAYLEGRLDQAEGQSKYLQSKLQEHIASTRRNRSEGF